MKIKTKLRFGFGFLFIVVLFFGGLALFYIDDISKSSKVILEDNYETLGYTRDMRKILDESSLNLSAEAIKKFETELSKEEGNITEKGEKEAVDSLKKAFKWFINEQISDDEKVKAEQNVRLHLRTIDELNMAAIVRKNAVAQASVKQATLLIGLVASITFMILFSFIVNFPGFVANPLREVLEGIREISRGNYRRRLEFSSKDEFTGIAEAFNEMAVRLNEWENSNLAGIKSEKLRIEAIIEKMQDAIIGLNEKQEILFINEVAEQILGLEARQSIGKSALELTKKNDLFNNVLENNKTDRTLKIYANGKESFFQLEKMEIVIPNYDHEEEETLKHSVKSAGMVYILRNITQFKELDEAKTNFIATVSHELKTPISSIMMSIKLMEDERVGSINPEQKELVQHIREDSDRLLKITSELLDLSQAETGKIQLNYKSVTPSQIISYALDSVKFQAEQKNIRLELISSPTLPAVNADVEKTAWVLINFLSNAMRYSPEKSSVLIQAVQKGNYVEFSVKDFGKGIDPQYQTRLFDRYFQVPTDGKNKSGSGLGLAISKDFIEAQNGRIWVESAIAEGSRFCFSLPVQS